ncbi:MAG: esterase-like activity of phytase family protein [Acidobacteriota bacterium]
MRSAKSAMEDTGQRRARRAWFVVGALMLLLVGVVVWIVSLTWSPAGGGPVEIAIDPLADVASRFGGLDDLSVWVLDADHPQFGGFSGLAVAGDRWLALSDRGWFWEATLGRDAGGRPTGFVGSRMVPLLDVDGMPVEGISRRDAEELVVAPDGFWVAFEQDHRLAFHSGADLDGPAVVVPAPDGLAGIGGDSNKGIEALVQLGDGSLLAIHEGTPGGAARDQEATWQAWLRSEPRSAGARWRPGSIPRQGPFRPTAATVVAPIDESGAAETREAVLMLQRHYDRERDETRVRLVRLLGDPRVDVALGERELARFEAPFPVDNFEALASEPTADGVRLFILSDDNFSDAQRTLLVVGELRRSSLSEASAGRAR